MDNYDITVKNDDEIDLRELIGILWSGRIKILVITSLVAVGSVIYALSLPNQYKATALLAPAQSDDSGLSSALGEFGGLATLAGVSISPGVISESRIAQEIMKSWSFIEKFISDNNIAMEIYAVEGWDKDSDELKVDQDIYDTEGSKWIVSDSSRASGPPTSWRLYKKFSGMISVSEEKLSGLVTISVEYFSPKIAKDWLDMYVAAINGYMQKRQINKVANNINYLETQIERTSIAEMKEVFYTIIEEQMKKKMVAEASPNYAFVAVSPSMVPEEKSGPKRALICIIGAFLGGLLSVLLVLVNHYARGSSVSD